MMQINLAHSPDSDDAYMFYALATGKIETSPYKINHILQDIETLNQAAEIGTHHISAISLHAYPFIAERYQLLPSGASVGDNYGPMVVANTPYSESKFRDEFGGKKSPKMIAVPGEKTTAFLALKLFLPEFRHQVMPFDQIMPAVQKGQVDAGLIIHEGQLNYAESGLHKVVDLGVWWRHQTGLPLPLGANVIRRDLAEGDKVALARLIKKSIEFALDSKHQKDALQYSLQFARGLDMQGAERFIQMYVNKRTILFDPECLKAIEVLYQKAFAQGLIPEQKALDMVQI